MSKRNINYFAEQTVNQINSTLMMLQEKHLAIGYNPIGNSDYTKSYCQITWLNHQMNRANAGSSFTKLEQYLFILRNNSYHCMMFDGSLIRVNFEFQDNILISQNLLWWPSPHNYGDLLLEGYSPVELFEDFYGDPKWHEVIKMRSPIRIDYDSTNNTELHPACHLHIQHENSRLVIDKPICFNRFIDFVFKNFYPDFKISFTFFDFIDYKTRDIIQLDYTSSKIIL